MDVRLDLIGELCVFWLLVLVWSQLCASADLFAIITFLYTWSTDAGYDADVTFFCFVFCVLKLKTNDKQNCWTSTNTYEMNIDKNIWKLETVIHRLCFPG